MRRENALISRVAGGFFVADNATILGDVTIGELSSFWFNVVVRGDVAPIRIGKRVNVQDATVIHVRSKTTFRSATAQSFTAAGWAGAA
jgi:carbonic anhydrase/acetyltransferase-like protein (isoleucine patch superfamily)